MADRNEAREVYHVVPDANAQKWVVSRENAGFTKEFDRKEDAEEFARTKAREAGLGQVKVHTRNGNMEYESTYGRDPKENPS